MNNGKKFDTKVQVLKYQVLKEVARHAFDGNLLTAAVDIPKDIIPGKRPTMRCCVYKERAILAERVKMAMGGDENVIGVIDIACDECPMGGYDVTSACRGCLAHRCESVCKYGAISFDHNHVAHIDKSKCRECGACAKVCPYSAIRNYIRPCERACRIKAISMDADKAAHIDQEKCIACGACVYQCPFGAITDKSYIVPIINMLKEAGEKGGKVFAVLAPSVASQFTYAKLGQVVTAIKKLGFSAVVEAALGADMVAQAEAKELAEKGMLTSSCCPAFVAYIRKNFPKLAEYVSGNLSPMATVAKYIKEKNPDCKIVFIGPCTAKKMEVQQEGVRDYVDAVMTFEELQALFDSREIELCELEESEFSGASYFGRIFARCGGLADAVKQGLDEMGADFDLKACSCDGIDECKMALLKLNKGVLDANFVEGMACSGGCIGGAGCLSHGEKSKSEVDKYGQESEAKTIGDALSKLD